jgi:hypothetical protein
MRLLLVNCLLRRSGEQWKVDDRQRAKSRLSVFRCPLSIITCALLFLLGCSPEVIYQPATGPVRLAEQVRAFIWVRNTAGVWVKSANRVVIPEGFDVLPPLAVSAPVTSVPKH